jgi:hypothetical protein
MAKMRFYDMDRATIVRVSNNINGWFAELRPGQKSVAWSPAQQQDLYFLADQFQTLISVVSNLNEIVQNGAKE